MTLNYGLMPFLAWNVMYLIDKLLIFLVSPLGTALFIGLLACLLGIGQRKRLALTFGFTALAWLLIWSLPIASNSFYNWVSRDYPALSISNVEPADAIVVLGGGLSPADRINPESDLNQAADRMVMAAKLFHAGKAQKIWLSGGRHPNFLTSEAQAMADFLLLLGVPKTAISLEESSRNTRENAKFTIDQLEATGVKKAILVTSALHMRRALGNFTNPTIMLIPMATDYGVRMQASMWQNFIPSTEALDRSSQAFKETAAWVLHTAMRML
jgi:uncharacterized SAM-binding protein YcdF (DUF218 family)